MNLFEVWIILSLGKHPKAIDCFMHENVADIIAWLAIIAASVAITNIGQKRLSVSHKAQTAGTNTITTSLLHTKHKLRTIVLRTLTLRINTSSHSHCVRKYHLEQTCRIHLHKNLGSSSKKQLGPYKQGGDREIPHKWRQSV